jgi:hypothetical protein
MNQHVESPNWRLPPIKRDRADARDNVLASRKKRKVRQLTWAKDIESQHIPPPCLPNDYDEKEIWYSVSGGVARISNKIQYDSSGISHFSLPTI